MALTGRRKQFLDTVCRLYEQTGEPVHYVTLAEQMGVSRWTAYDMLKELERAGHLKAEYTINVDERPPGRSMIRFVPIGGAWSEEWVRVRTRLETICRRYLAAPVPGLIEDLVREMGRIERPMIFCAYALTALALRFRSLVQTESGLADCLDRFQCYLAEISGEERQILLDFMKDTLNLPALIRAHS